MTRSAEEQSTGGAIPYRLVSEVDEGGADEVVYLVVRECRSCGGNELLLFDSSPSEMGEVPVDLVEDVLEERRIRCARRCPPGHEVIGDEVVVVLGCPPSQELDEVACVEKEELDRDAVIEAAGREVSECPNLVVDVDGSSGKSLGGAGLSWHGELSIGVCELLSHHYPSVHGDRCQ